MAAANLVGALESIHNGMAGPSRITISLESIMAGLVGYN